MARGEVGSQSVLARKGASGKRLTPPQLCLQGWKHCARGWFDKCFIKCDRKVGREWQAVGSSNVLARLGASAK